MEIMNLNQNELMQRIGRSYISFKGNYSFNVTTEKMAN